jgi:hypothetical protein
MRESSRVAFVVMMAVVLTRASAAVGEPRRLDLVWVDPVGIAAGVYPSLAAESRAVLAALGTEVRWTPAPRGAVVGPESLVVIAIPSHPRSSARERHVMGATRALTDEALAVWVFPDQVAWALGLDLDRRASWGKIAEAHFARAVARVASHEVIHALGAPGHTRGGLMAASLSRQALTTRALGIDRETAAVVRRTLDRGMMTASGAPSLPPRGREPVALTPELVAQRSPGR